MSRLAQQIAAATVDHLMMVAIAMAIAGVIGVGGGILLTRRPSWRGWVMGLAGVIQTIPSLALFGFLIPLPWIGGIGSRTAILALALYALLPVLRNTLTGILDVSPTVRESAVAMGMTDRQILRQVELPLAARTILAGIRIATVTTIGTAAIAAVIGGGGLGTFIFRGVATVDTTQLLAGAVPAALLALGAEGALGWVESRFTPPS